MTVKSCEKLEKSRVALPIEASDPIRQPISTGAKYFCRMRR